VAGLSTEETTQTAQAQPAELIRRIAGFSVGCTILAFGIVLSVKANLGAAAWDVLHLAIAQRVGLSLGQASILVSAILVVLTVLLGGRWTVSWGTVANALLVGWAIDGFLALGIPGAASIPARVVYLAGAIFFLALGSVVYTRVGLGAGSRDGLILVLSQRLPLTVGRVRLCLEFLVAVGGWLLGGPIGVGTLAIVVGTGPTADLLFRVLGRGYLPDNVRIPESRRR